MDQEECQIVNHISTGFVWPGSTNGWWLGFHQNRVPPSEWKENFRMSRESFLVLRTELNDHIVKSSTRFRKAVSVEEEVPLILYCLSDEGRLRKTATPFGLGKSAVSHIIRLVYKAIAVHLTSKHIKMSRTKEAVEESVSNFYSRHRFPQCIGLIFELRVILVTDKFDCLWSLVLKSKILVNEQKLYQSIDN